MWQHQKKKGLVAVAHWHPAGIPKGPPPPPGWCCYSPGYPPRLMVLFPRLFPPVNAAIPPLLMLLFPWLFPPVGATIIPVI